MRDPEFARLAHLINKLCEDPEGNKKEIEEAVRLINIRAAELAKQARQNRPRGMAKKYPFLDPEPHGIPIEYLDLEGDKNFMDLAAQRQELLDDAADSGADHTDTITELEAKMNEIASDKALDYIEKWNALHSQFPWLPADINGIPLEQLQLLDDPYFKQLASTRQHLLTNHGLSPTDGKIQSLEKRMADRAYQLAIECDKRNTREVRQEDTLDDKYPFADIEYEIIAGGNPEADRHFRELADQHAALTAEAETQYGGVHRDQLCLFLPLQYVSQYHFTCRIDPGIGNDD